jgi:hypothetical protein
MELGDLDGVQNVTTDMKSRQVVVEWGQPATWDKIESLMVEINYPPAS